MDNKKIDRLKQEYQDLPIPEELDKVVRKGITDAKKGKRAFKVLTKVAAVAGALAIFVGGINISPTMASALAEVPGMKKIVQVLTFGKIEFDDGWHVADIETPAITGLEESGLGETLNQKYLEENQKLYEEFMAEVKAMEEFGESHFGVVSGYEVKTDNERLLAIGRYVLSVAGSSSTVYKYDTIDKVNEVLITLPSLFKDDSYIEVISKYLVEEMKARMEADPNLVYWVEREDAEEELYFEPFTTIAPDQSFYINSDYKLVISFDKYEIGPGYMGIQEFIIPTEIIADHLVSNEYIKP